MWAGGAVSHGHERARWLGGLEAFGVLFFRETISLNILENLKCLSCSHQYVSQWQGQAAHLRLLHSPEEQTHEIRSAACP